MSNDTPKQGVDVPYETSVDEQTLSLFKTRVQNANIRNGRGSPQESTSNLLTGFNHRMAPLYAPKNVDGTGYVFWTRPDMNFNEDNVNQSRRMLEMLRGKRNSQMAALIGMLDPFCEMLSVSKDLIGFGNTFHHEVGFDNRCAFIPVLSNLLVSLSGFPDSTLDVYTSEEGMVREQWSMVDSTYQPNSAFNLNATFRNVDGDVITSLIGLMLEYAAGVRTGLFLPRPINMFTNTIDYQMRCYRFILDPTRRYVRKYGIANALFPTNDSMGMIMNISGSQPLITDNDQLSIQFQANVASYNDPIIIQEFNDLVRIFNPDMQPYDPNGFEYLPRAYNSMVMLTPEIAGMMNFNGYPQIDPNTYEFQWWVYADDYNRRYKELMNG